MDSDILVAQNSTENSVTRETSRRAVCESNYPIRNILIQLNLN